MTVRFVKPCIKQYKKLSPHIRDKFDRQLQILLHNFRHPSLHTKRMRGKKVVWEARVDYQYRFTFEVKETIILIRSVGPHGVLKKP